MCAPPGRDCGRRRWRNRSSAGRSSGKCARSIKICSPVPEKLRELDAQIKAAAEAYRQAQAETKAGTGIFLNEITAQAVLLNSELDLANEIFNRKVIDWICGGRRDAEAGEYAACGDSADDGAGGDATGDAGEVREIRHPDGATATEGSGTELQTTHFASRADPWSTQDNAMRAITPARSF